MHNSGVFRAALILEFHFSWAWYLCMWRGWISKQHGYQIAPSLPPLWNIMGEKCAYLWNNSSIKLHSVLFISSGSHALHLLRSAAHYAFNQQVAVWSFLASDTWKMRDFVSKSMTWKLLFNKKNVSCVCAEFLLVNFCCILYCHSKQNQTCAYNLMTSFKISNGHIGLLFTYA